MKCIDKSCDSTSFVAHVQASIVLPLTQKGGSVSTAGTTVKQSDLKEWWDGPDDAPKLIRGPIYCAECMEEYVYLKGSKNSFRAMSYTEALQIGYEALCADDV